MEEKENIGHLLRSNREKQNLSLEEVANKTKISINMLRYLEANELKKLPNKTFVKGFVQNYSKCIGLDKDLAAFILENTYSDQEPKPPTFSEHKEEAQDEPAPLSMEQLELQDKIVRIVHAAFNKRLIVGLGLLIIFVLAIRSIASFFTQISEEQVSVSKITGSKSNPIKSKDENLFDLKASKKLIVDQSKPKKVANKKNANTEAKVETKTPEKKEEVIEEAKEAVKIEEKKLEVKEQSEPSPKKNLNGKYPYKEFYSIRGKMYDLSPNAPETKDENLLPQNIKDAALPGKANVYVNATEDDTWISYKVDDQKITRYILKKGRSLLLKGDIILLFLGNINVTKIFYNNQFVAVESKTGVKSLVFPQELSKNYELPLFPTYQGIPYTAKEYKENMEKKPPKQDESE